MRRPAVPTFKLEVWKIADLVRSPLNSRIGIEDDPDTHDLAQSLKTHGLLQEPAVRSDGTIIFGTRRVFAARIAGWQEIPCKTYPKNLTKLQEHFIRIEENFRRKDLNPVERAKELESFVSMQTGRGKQKAAAGMLGITEEVVSRHLSILSLPPVWQDLIANGTADPSHTRCIQTAARIHESLPEALAKRFEEIHQKRNLSVREWEIETDTFIKEQCRPVADETKKTLLAMYEPHRGELDIRTVNGQPMAFNLPLWTQLTFASEQKDSGSEPDVDNTGRLPQVGHRHRIALNWFNRRIMSIVHRYPSPSLKWLPLFQIPTRVSQEAIATARGLKDWDLDAGKSVPIIAKVKGTAVSTFLADYAKAVAAIALRSRLQLVKGFHFAQTVAAGMGIDYATEFLTTLDDDDQKDLFNVYGTLPPPGKFPRGMDPRSLRITKEPV